MQQAFSWIYYVAMLCLQIWLCVWFIYFTASKFNSAVALLQGFDRYGQVEATLPNSLLSLALWIVLPLVVHGNRTFINTLDYLRKRDKTRKFLGILYCALFLLLIAPQVVFVSFIGIPTIINSIVPMLPWASPTSNNTMDKVVLSLAMIMNIISTTSAYCYLALAAHLQSYQIIDFIRNHIMERRKMRITGAKHVLHLVAESLRDGNARVEPLNAVVLLGIMLEVVGIIAKLLTQPFWDLTHFLPFLILLTQAYFLLIPPAYISKCWDRVFSQILALHALAPTPEDELSSIILYMKNVYAGYSLVSVRIDGTKILYFTILVLVLLGAKAQQEVDPSWFFY